MHHYTWPLPCAGASTWSPGRRGPARWSSWPGPVSRRGWRWAGDHHEMLTLWQVIIVRTPAPRAPGTAARWRCAGDVWSAWQSTIWKLLTSSIRENCVILTIVLLTDVQISLRGWRLQQRSEERPRPGPGGNLVTASQSVGIISL